MRISKKKRQELYKAFSDPIMKVRINIAQTKPSLPTVDEKLFRLEQEIWQEIKATLEIKEG
jgi:archaellum component FlaC